MQRPESSQSSSSSMRSKRGKKGKRSKKKGHKRKKSKVEEAKPIPIPKSDEELRIQAEDEAFYIRTKEFR